MKNILLTTDFSPEAAKAFNFAKEYARLIGIDEANLVLLNVVEAPALMDVYGLGVGYVDLEGIVDEAVEAASERMSRILIEDFSGFQVEPLIVKAKKAVYDEIVAVAEERGMDMIVMAAHGRAGIQHFLLGSVSEKVLRLAHCPLVLVPVKDSVEEE